MNDEAVAKTKKCQFMTTKYFKFNDCDYQIIYWQMNSIKKNSLLSQSRSASKYQSIITRTLLSDLFSKQFLTNVRSELRGNQKNSKNIQSQKLIQQSQSAIQRVQIESLMSKLKDLTKQNSQLKQKLNLINSSNQNVTILNNKAQQIKKSPIVKQMNIIRQVELVIQPQKQIIKQQIYQLREKIQNLQKQKAIKQERLTQLIEKQTRYQSQMRFLRAKDQNLQQQIKNLKQTIKSQVKDVNDKPLKETNRSEIKLRISQSNLEHSRKQLLKWFQNQEQANDLLNKLIVNLQRNSESQLLVSECQNIELPNSIQLNNTLAVKKSFSQGIQIKDIDDIIQSELPFLHLSEYPSIQNNELHHQNLQNKRQELQQSQICIDFNSNNKLQGNIIDQSAIFIDTHSFPPSSRNSEENQSNILEHKINLNESAIQINLNI